MPPSRAAVVGAFAVIYLVWGSTYLGIYWAIETIPPLLMAALRFLAAGAVLYAWAAWRGASRPAARDWGGAVVVGGLMLTAGNGFLSLAETRMPTGVAALLIATVPLWIVLFNAALDRRRPSLQVWAGIAAGLAGVAVLSGAQEGWKGGLHPLYIVLVLLGSMAWALGSVLSRRRPTRPRAVAMPLAQVTAMQMLGGGALLLVWAAFHGDLAAWEPAATSARSVAAWAYLVGAGSILALTCYLWLLKVSAPALVATYAFVNPVVAVAIGSLVLSEPLTARTGLAGLLIVAAVALIVHANARATRAARGVAAGPPPGATAGGK